MPSEKQIQAATTAIVDKIKADGFIGYREAVSIILTAAEQAEPAPAARSGAVKVKQLEWEETHTRRSDEDPTTEWNGGFEADSALGYYEISTGIGSDAYYWAVTNPLGDNVGSDFEDPSYAKAAAQADYERRILSALEPAAQEGHQDDEPVAWGVVYRGKIVAVSLHKGYHYTVPLYARPTERAVTDEMELARAVLAQSITAGHNVPGPTPKDIENAFWALDSALKADLSQECK